MLAFSDLQWADASSLEALKRCLPICDTAPVLWLASFRPDRASPVWAFSHHVVTEYPHRLTSIDLPPLTADESRALVEALLGVRPDALADRALELVIEKGEGNPYYLREIIYALIGQGLLRQDAAGGWRPTQPIASFDLPGSLRSLLLARIDRLAADERRVLQIAAVIGPLFWRKVLAGCLEDGDLLRRCLANLQRGQLIHEQSLTPDLGMEYTFTPSLVRDIIYESLLNSQRAAYHRLVAEQIEAKSPPNRRSRITACWRITIARRGISTRNCFTRWAPRRKHKGVCQRGCAWALLAGADAARPNRSHRPVGTSSARSTSCGLRRWKGDARRSFRWAHQKPPTPMPARFFRWPGTWTTIRSSR